MLFARTPHCEILFLPHPRVRTAILDFLKMGKIQQTPHNFLHLSLIVLIVRYRVCLNFLVLGSIHLLDILCLKRVFGPRGTFLDFRIILRNSREIKAITVNI